MTNDVGASATPRSLVPASQIPANARNTPLSKQGSFTEILESTNSAATSPTTGTHNAARKEAEYWVNFAESLLAMMGEAMVNYNRHLDLMKNHWANIARAHGPEVAARLKAEDTILTRHEKLIRSGQTALTDAFELKGEIVLKDAEGNYHFGDFTLTRIGEGFSLKIDSRLGASVVYGTGSGNGPGNGPGNGLSNGSGASGYRLISTLNSAFLPWTLADGDGEEEYPGQYT